MSVKYTHSIRTDSGALVIRLDESKFSPEAVCNEKNKQASDLGIVSRYSVHAEAYVSES